MKKITVVNDETSLDQDFFNTLQDNVEEVFNGDISMGSIRVDNIECKNLARDYGVGGTSQYGTSLYIDFDIEPDTQYTVSVNSNLTKSNVYPNEKIFKNAKWISTSGRLSFTGLSLDSTSLASISKSDYGYSILKNHSALSTTPTFSEPQIEKGDVETPYTPYKEFSNKQIYSTNEQTIGTWIDGKTLYRKVFQTTSISSENSNLVDISNLNINAVVNLRGVLITSTGLQFTMPLYDSSSNYSVLFISSNYIRGRATLGSGTLSKCYIILEYTKTDTSSVSTTSLEDEES